LGERVKPTLSIRSWPRGTRRPTSFWEATRGVDLRLGYGVATSGGRRHQTTGRRGSQGKSERGGGGESIPRYQRRGCKPLFWRRAKLTGRSWEKGVTYTRTTQVFILYLRNEKKKPKGSYLIQGREKEVLTGQPLWLKRGPLCRKNRRVLSGKTL